MKILVLCSVIPFLIGWFVGLKGKKASFELEYQRGYDQCQFDNGALQCQKYDQSTANQCDRPENHEGPCDWIRSD